MSEIDKIQLKDASGQLIAEYDLPGGSSSDTKVTQTYTNSYSNDYNYELLFSETPANTMSMTEGSRKNYNFRFNPYKIALTIGSRFEYDETKFPPEVPYGTYSTVVGENCAATNNYSFAHGLHAIADGYGSFASGDNVEASNGYAHAEGSYTRAAGYCTHAEGRNTFAYGDSSHAEGYYASAVGNYSHAEGYHTDADSGYQHVQGKYNRIDSNDVYAHIVGNGTANNARSNAYALRWNGQQDVTNDIVRVDSGGTWDGFNASLEAAFKQNLGECCNYEEVEGVTRNYQYYKIAEIEVNPGTAEDNYEHQYDISNPLVFEVSQIVADATWGSDTGYSVLYIAFKLNTTSYETEILQFKTSNSMDFKLRKDSNNSNIWILYGIYRSITQQTPLIKNKSVLHRITGSGFNNNVTVVMQNVESTGIGQSPDRDCIKSSGDIIHGPIIFGAPRWNVQTDRTCDIQFQSDLVGTWDGEETSLKAAVWDCAKRGQITGEYSALSTYEVGDFCIYLNTLYVCNTAISTPEDFDSTHWTATTIENSFVKKSGDTMTGQLIGMAGGTSWVRGRTVASLVNTAYDGSGSWFPITSVKSKDGSWEMGTLTGSNNLYFSYASDTNFNNNANQTGKYIISQHSTNGDYYIAHSGNVGTGDSNGQVKIAGTNVSVKGLGSRAYDSTAYLPLAGGTMTGNITRKYSDISISANPSANKYYTPITEQDKNGNSIGFIGCYQYTNGTIGERIYCTRKVGSNTIYHGIQLNISTTGARSVNVDDAGVWRSALGLTLNWWNGVPKIGSDGLIEIGKYIDFHTASSSTSDYDFRFTNNASGKLTASGTITQGSSRKIKENIKPLSEKEALKILNLEPVSFDYKESYGGDKDHRGFIAEDVAEILPNLTSEEYGDEKDLKHFTPMSLSYNEIIPYLVKVIQIQQNQINALTEKVEQLEVSGFKFEV